MARHTPTPKKRRLAHPVVLTLLAALLLWIPVADTVSLNPFGSPDDVPFTDGSVADPDDSERGAEQQEAAEETAGLDAPVWPSYAVADIPVEDKLTAGKGMPVAVSAAEGSAPGSVEVTVHGQKASTKAGVAGMLVDVSRSDGRKTESEVEIAMDYSFFAHAYGADWASRLALWQINDGQTTRVESTNNRADGTVTATITVNDAKSRFALMADTAGANGDFSATELSPSATWSQGGNSGGFSWSYPIEAPNPVGAGPMPTVSLDYSSASVDGRSEATNNQPGWVGEGWGLSVGSIERRYASCLNDMDDGANNSTKTGDKCWVTGGTVTMNLAGHAGEMIRDDATDTWHLKNDDGTRIEKRTDTSNADDSNEYWIVTTPDGVKYHFGLNRLPGWPSGNAETKSVWTVPVAGNHANEPCHATAFKDSFCDQAWKWNLDYVEDPSGNTMSYWYTPQTNKYAKNLDSSNPMSYIRGGELSRIDYGTDNRDDTEYTGNAPARMVFDSADRCLSDCSTHSESKWPDTPWDSECTGSTCETYSPSFWSTKRLSKITTEVWDTTTSKHQPVDSWTLGHTFPNPGDGSRAGLWLDSIKRTGHVGGTLELPAVKFDWTQMENRVEVYDGVSTMNWMRMGSIWTETGARISVAYSARDCADGNLPSAPGSNTRLCYPVKVPDPFDPDKLLTHWYHKYVVKSVSEYDRLTETDKITRYEYVGSPAWRYAEPDALVENKFRTWSDWRGYSAVHTKVGDGDTATLSVTSYFRGMDGDKDPAGGTRDIKIPASVGNPIDDNNLYAGMARETTVYNGVESAPVSRQIFEPWKSSPTATRVFDGHTYYARYVHGDAVTYGQTALDGGRGWRTTKTSNKYDEYGMTTQVTDDGDVDVADDQRCTYTEYARNTGKNILTTAKRERTTTLACGTEPSSGDQIISDARYSYDGLAHGATPTKGLTTATETINGFTGGTPTYVVQSRSGYDALGRVKDTWDVKENKTSTTYTPATGRYASVTTTTPMEWTSIKTFDLRGKTLTDSDVNAKVTTSVYDPLGRVTKVWLPSRATSASASYEFSYTVSNLGKNSITTKKLNSANTVLTSNYTVSTELLDGLLRSRQTQTVSPGDGGGRIITDTLYDAHGRAYASQGPYRSTGEPDGELFLPDAEVVVKHTETRYDRADRVTDDIQYDLHEELWRTSTVYGGDYTTVIPPEGAVPTSTLTDARGQTTETRQHLTREAGDPYQSTVNTYNSKGQLEKVTDAEGNAWEYGYDIRGNKIEEHHPDKGTTISSYNDAGELLSTTDANDTTLSYQYDQLGRKTALFDGDTTGTKLIEWRYDSSLREPIRGHLAGWSRYVEGAEYRFDVGTYNDLYQMGNTRYTIPSVEGKLAGTYTVINHYNPDGSLNYTTYPAAGGQTTETLTYKYDSRSGLPLKLTGGLGSNGYVTNTAYTGLGELQAVTYAHGMAYTQQTNFYDDATRRLTQTRVLNQQAPNLVSSTDYDYDPAGNITSVKEEVADDYQCFDYDTLRRLTEAWTPADGDCDKPAGTDTLGGPAKYWNSYKYDAIGNRVTSTNHVSASGVQTTEYTTPEPGKTQPHTITDTKTTAPGSDPVEAAYSYDAAGNLTSRPGNTPGQTQELTWNAEGRLDTVTEGDKETSNVYTADGDRLIRHSPDGSATLYLPGQDITVNAAGVLSCSRYYSYAGSTFAVRTGSTLYWQFNDHQDTAQVTIQNTAGASTRRYQDPYGNPRGAAANWPGQRGFVNGVNDPTGLTHIGAREYDPGLGGFISSDPIIDFSRSQQMHGYTYASNSPVTSADPTGLFEGKIDDVAKGNGRHSSGAFKDNRGKNFYVNDNGTSYRSDGNGNLTIIPQRGYQPGNQGHQVTPDPEPCAIYDITCYGGTAMQFADSATSDAWDSFMYNISQLATGTNGSSGICLSGSYQEFLSAGVDLCIMWTKRNGWGMTVRPHAGFGPKHRFHSGNRRNLLRIR